MEPAAAYIVTPNEVDAGVGIAFLREAGIEARAAPSLSELCRRALEEVGCAVLVEEALTREEIAEFHAHLARQPAWSDLPLVLVASEGAPLGAFVESVFPESGNLAVLQRPMNPVSLVSAVRVGLRARARQFQVRDLLEQRAAALRHRDEFLAMLAHELRNPLAPIRNAVYIMNQLDIGDATFARTRDMVDRQVTHMARLVDDLLDVSRLQLGKVQLRMEVIDLNAAVTSATEACLPMTTLRKHSVELRLSHEPLFIRADPVRLEQVIANLVTNAAKFTPQGGTILVRASGDEATARVSVKDSGIGIAPEMLGAVFDLFTQGTPTLARAEGGLGIGLTLVKRLVELHGGSVEVSSDGAGRGSEFTLRFARAPAPAVDASAETRAASAGAIRRVLVIEDNPDIRESIGMLLRMWGHVVEFADNGPDGVERAKSFRPDIALVDIGLPGFNGYEVAKHVRSAEHGSRRKVMLVALTGYGRDSDREQALEAGFDAHLVKPIAPDVLAKTLQLGSLPRKRSKGGTGRRQG